jgi:hypothetical protein
VERKIITLAGVFFLLAVTSGFAQEQGASQAAPIPAASRSEMDCSGFIAGVPVSSDLYVFDGADNDFRELLRGYAEGEFVYLRSRTGGESFTVGSEYSIVRAANESLGRGFWYPTAPRQLSVMGNISWYPGQAASVRSLGKPYQDVGRVKVIKVTPHGAVAEVTFVCSPLNAGDVALPYQQRAIPQYTPSAHFDRFALPNGKLVGAITAAGDHAAHLGLGSIAYLNLGHEDGVTPGQRYRVFRIFRNTLDRGVRAIPEPPREIIGELVILSTQERSSVGIVVNSLREISLGDGIELE